MANESGNGVIFEPERYNYAVAALQFLAQKKIRAAGNSLEAMADVMEVPKDAKGLMRAAFTDPKYMQASIEEYSEEYNKMLGIKTVRSLLERYQAELGEYLEDEERANAIEAFTNYGNMLYSDIVKEVVQADEVINSPTGRWSEEEKKEAKKTREKYGVIYDTVQEYESLRIQPLMFPILKSTIKGSQKERFKPKEKQAEGEAA